MQSNFELSTLDGDSLVLRARGEFDLVGELTVLAAAVPYLMSGNTVIVDLGEVAFIDSSGLRALEICQRAAQAGGGQLLLRSTTPHLAYVLKANGLPDEQISTAA